MIRSVQRFLWAAGFVSLGYCGMAWIHTSLHQFEGNAELDRLLNSGAPAVTVITRHGGLVGRMEIPRLQLSSVIFEGTDEQVLAEGVGHLSGSALPGETGNVVLAGHRDSIFRALRNIKTGDIVQVTTQQGTRSYSVDSTEIVQPTKISVLEPTKSPTLTLVTCYPFYFVGSAPQRFIVKGHDLQSTRAKAATRATS